MTSGRWSEEEHAFLEKNYGRRGVTSYTIAKHLGRSRNSIVQRAHLFGLAVKRGTTEFRRRCSEVNQHYDWRVPKTKEDIIFVIAVLETEGSVAMRGDKKRPDRTVYRIKVGMTTRGIVDEMQRICGGVVRGPYKSRNAQRQGRKPIYEWEISSLVGVAAILSTILPYYKYEKREHIIKVLAELETRVGKP